MNIRQIGRDLGSGMLILGTAAIIFFGLLLGFKHYPEAAANGCMGALAFPVAYAIGRIRREDKEQKERRRQRDEYYQ